MNKTRCPDIRPLDNQLSLSQLQMFTPKPLRVRGFLLESLMPDKRMCGLCGLGVMQGHKKP